MKRATLVLAALALLLGGVDQAKAGFMTLNDPSATGGTFAYGISGSNIVGYYSDGTGYHVFLYNGTSYTTLNDPSATNGTFALGISGSNIVGDYSDGTGYHGFLYNGTSYTTLNDSSATNGTFALGISGSNIVGWYSDGMGAHGFLYQPDVSAVPEPSSLTLLGVGALCL